jgi:hypothetical protein
MLDSSRILAASLVLAMTGSFLATTTTEARTTPAANDQAGALVMREGDGQNVAGWTEHGSVRANHADGSANGELRHLRSIADRLVAIGSTVEPGDGPRHDVVYHTLDGMTWFPATVPSTKPRFSDLASAGEALVLGGSDRVGGKRKARLWTSSDGVGWTKLAVPSRLKRIDQIVSAGAEDAPLVVRSGQNLWARQDGDDWTFITKLIDMPILHGPGGFLAAQFPNRILLHWDDDLGSITEVPLPKAMGKNPDLLADAQLFALEDQWILVPHVLTNPDTIYASSDGLAWTEIPRPGGIVAGAVRWMADVGAGVQAFGAVDGDDGDEGGIWTFVPGEPVAEPATMARSDEFIDAPVAFGDGYAASGLRMGRRWALTSWGMPS